MKNTRKALHGASECLAHLEASEPGRWKKDYAGIMTRSAWWRSERCRLSWKTMITRFRRMLLQIAMLHPRSPAVPYSLLPTPMATDGTRGANRALSVVNGKISNTSAKGVRYGISICQLASHGLRPTPRARVSGGNCSVNRGKANLEDRISQVLKPVTRSSRVSACFITEMMGYPYRWTILPYRAKNKAQEQK